MIVKIARDPREFESAFYHSQWRVAVPIQNAIRKRAVVCPDTHGDPPLLAKIDKGRKPLPNPIQLARVLLIGVFADNEFLRIGVIARVDPHLFHPFGRLHCCFGLEMDVGDNRHIAAALT